MLMHIRAVKPQTNSKARWEMAIDRPLARFEKLGVHFIEGAASQKAHLRQNVQNQDKISLFIISDYTLLLLNNMLYKDCDC